MLNSEKNILVVYVQKKLKKFYTKHKKRFATLGKTKALPPPPLFMLNGRSLMLICMISLKTVYDV
jgi:hypothetical protein